MTVAPCVPHLGSWRAKLLLDFKNEGRCRLVSRKYTQKTQRIREGWRPFKDSRHEVYTSVQGMWYSLQGLDPSRIQRISYTLVYR